MYAAKAGKSTLGIPQKVGAEFVAAGPKPGKLPARVGAAPKSSTPKAPTYPPLSSLAKR